MWLKSDLLQWPAPAPHGGHEVFLYYIIISFKKTASDRQREATLYLISI
jgi:hypothetical protein